MPGQTKRTIAGMLADFMGGTTFATIFTSFNERLWQLEILGTLKDIIFPAAAFVFLAKLLISTYDLFFSRSTHNKSAGKWADFAVKLAGTVIVSVAVIGSIVAAAAYAVLAPVLFIAALGVEFLHSSSLLLWNAVKLFSLKKPASLSPQADSDQQAEHEIQSNRYHAERAQYKANITKYGIGAFCTGVATAATALLMLTKVGLIPLSIGLWKTTVAGVVGDFAATTAALGSAFGIKAGINVLREEMKKRATVAPAPELSPESKGSQADETNDGHPLIVETKLDSPKASISLQRAKDLTLTWQTPTSMFAPNYSPYFTKCREALVERIATDGSKISFLKSEIKKKIDDLSRQISIARDAFFSFGILQEEKRMNKMLGLFLLEKLIDPLTSRTYSLVNDIALNNFKIKYSISDSDEKDFDKLRGKLAKAGVDESFWFLEADTTNLINAIETYVKIAPPATLTR